MTGKWVMFNLIFFLYMLTWYKQKEEEEEEEEEGKHKNETKQIEYIGGEVVDWGRWELRLWWCVKRYDGTP